MAERSDRRTLILDADLSKALAGLRQLDANVDKSAAKAGKISSNLGRAEKEAGKLGAATGKMGSALSAMSGGLGGIANAVAGLPGPFMAVAAAAGAAAGAIKLVNDETARLDKIAKSAQKSGLGFDAYQRLAHMATLSGTNIEALSKSVLKLTVNLRDMQGGGGKEAAEALEEIGLSLKDLSQLEDTERLAVISDHLSRVTDESTKSALAFKIFGKTGTELIPMLNSGGEALREMSAGAERLFTREELAKAEAYQDSLANLNKAVSDIKGDIAVGLAPVLTDLNNRFTSGGKEARDRLAPAIQFVGNRVAAAIKPIIAYVTFFAEGLATVARGAEKVGDLFSIATDAIGEGASKVRDWLSDSFVGGAARWAKDTAREVVNFADGALSKLTSAIEEQLPWTKNLGAAWDSVRDTIADTGKLGESPEIVDALKEVDRIRVETQQKIASQSEKIQTSEAERIKTLERQSIAAEHQVNMLAAQGKTAKELEAAYLEQYATKLALLHATGQIAEAEKAIRDEQVRQAKTSAPKKGGRGPTEADRLKAQGETILREWDDRLALMEVEASLLFEGTIEFEAERHRIALANLRLEQGVLAAKKGGNSVEKAERAARIEGIDRELELLQKRFEFELQSASTESAASAAEQRIAALDREIERNDALGVSVRLLQEQRNAAALDYAERFGDDEALRQEQHDQEMARIAEVAERERKREEARRKMHEDNLKRLDAQRKKQQQTTNSINGFAQQGQAVGNLILEHAIKNDKKREKAALRLGGVMAMVRGAVEVVEAVAAAASFNIPQAILHGIAAGVAFTQGAIMMAGNVPSGGSASSAGGASGGGSAANSSSYEGPSSKETRERPSTPASAEAQLRLRGGYSDAGGSSSQKPAAGNVTQINAGVIVTGDSGHQLGEVANRDKKGWG